MSEGRLSGYLHTRQRITLRRDAARRNNSGKTGTLRCNPPNKKCGDRCIPPNWNCRITGGGLDSHSRVVEFDPVKGSASVIRGTKNVIEGYKKGDPEKIARGIKGVERGIVKLTPGNSIEDKQRFRKRLKTAVNIAFIGTVTVLGAHRSHQLLKRGFPEYRNGLGAEIDRSARQAVDRVMDTWDTGVGAVGLSSILGTGRAGVAAGGQAAAARLGYQSVVRRAAENRLAQPARVSQYLSTRARLRGTGTGISAVHDIDAQAREQGWSYERWMTAKTQRLYSLEENGRSVFATPAAHELLARQWGFQLDPRPLRQAGSGGTLPAMSNEVSRVRRMLPERIAQMHTDMAADLQRRRLPMTRQGMTDYANALLAENPNLAFGRTARERERAATEFRSRVRDVLSARSSPEQHRLAKSVYDQTVDFYNDFFRQSASRLAVDADGNLRLPATDIDSPYRDAVMGMARFHAAQRPRVRTPGGVRTAPQPRYPFRVTSGEVARFLNRDYYERRVRNNPVTLFEKPEQLRRIASEMSGGAFEGPQATQAAIDWFTSSGFSVGLGRPPRPQRPPTPPRNPRITRSDAAGKPCGKSHIPQAHKCHSSTAAVPVSKPAAKPSGAPEVAGNKHDKAYRVRQVASIVARVGAVGGGAVFAVVVGRQGFKTRDLDTLKAAGAGVIVSALALKSLQRERVVTHDAKALQERYEKLKANEAVDSATVDKLQKFIADTEMDSQRVPTMMVLGGLGGYFDSAKPNRVHISTEGMTLQEASKDKDPAKAYSKGVEMYMKYRAGLTSERIIDGENTSLSNMKRNFSASHWIGNKEGKADYLLAHEIAHAIHYRSGFATPKAVVVNGKRYEGKELEAELKRSTSYYGQSDLIKKSDSADNYYEQGNRLETYSENFALYLGNARSMKELFPVSHEWTRQTTEYALSKPPATPPRKFLDIVKELADGTERFEPRSLASKRRDAPEDEATILQMLTAIKNAAINGDIGTTLEIFSQAQALPQDVRFMFGAYLETAFMYSQIKQSAKPSSDTL